MLTYFLIRLMLVAQASSSPEERESAPLFLIKFTLAIDLMLCYVYQSLNYVPD